jgi:hypothetical protein
MYRINRNEQDPIVDVNTAEEIEPAVRRVAPGRYYIDEISVDPSRGARISRRWGVAIRYANGSIVIERDPVATRATGIA